MKTEQKRKYIFEGIFLIILFLIYFSLSCFLPVEKAPDEYMRYEIPEYIHIHHSLPAGYEEEIRDETWGFSYGFTPYLPSILAAGMMDLVSIFSGSTTALIIASRFISVLAMVASVWLAFRIGDILFPSLKNKLFYAFCIGLLPQAVFLAAYLNNDAFALFTAMLILYAWLYGKENHWNIRSCILLAVGIALCALTYYNAYGWILCSVIYYFGSIWFDSSIDHKWKHAISHGCLIAAAAFLLAGWFFIRNAVLYQGDFLGMDTMYAYGELYGYEGYKPSNRQLFAAAGLPFYSMLLMTDWVESTVRSFFAVFGYMDVEAAELFYVLYCIISILGAASFIIGICRKIRKKQAKAEELLLYGCCMICMLIPIILSIRYSYAIDYQPQGRYIMSGLPAFALLLVRGYQSLDELWKEKKGYATGLVCLVWVLMFAVIFVTVMIPKLYLGIK